MKLDKEDLAVDAISGLVSVVIPCYKCAGSIAAVLNGVLAQAYSSIEVIVVNDASPDDLDEQVRPYLGKVKYLKNVTNLGLSKTYNVGIRASVGEYVLTLHSDCVLEPTYVAALVDIIKRDETIAVVTGQYLFENFSKLALSDKLFAVLNLLPVDGSCTNRSTLDEIAFFEGKADLFRRNILDEYGLFNERLSLTAEDQDLSARMRADGYKICQNTNCRFKVFFSATQDTIWKVLNKQRTYARGQAFVIAKHKGGVFARTTRNRNLRMIHRIGQLAFIGISMFVAVLAWVWPIMLPMLVLITLSRVGYYMFLGRKLCTWECLVSGVVGLAGDYFYAVGFIQGLMLKMLRERG